MKPRIDYAKLQSLIGPTTAALISISTAVRQSGLDPKLVELVKIRASQINGCAFCLHMHTTEARAQGETDERLHLLNAWREAPLYNERERAALAWTEALTRITEGHAPDDVYDAARRVFSEPELAMLTSEIVAINAWNRIAIAYRFAPDVAKAAPAAKRA